MALQVVGRGQKHIIERDPSWPPGRHQATFAVHDVSYRDDLGQWQPADETLVDDTSVTGFIGSCTKLRHTVRFGSAGERRWYPRRDHPNEYVETAKPDYWASTRWRVWNLTGLTRGTNTVTWETTTYKVVVTNTWHQLRLSYTLKTSSAYTRVRYPWVLAGLTFDNATREFRSIADGTVLGTLNEPMAEDANGQAVPVTGNYAGGFFEIVLTPGSAVYPITMDPDDTFTDGYGGNVDTAKDTYLYDVMADKGYGSTSPIAFGLSANIIGLFGFDLSGIDAAATCDSATFYLYVASTKTTQRTLTINELLAANAAWVEGVTQDPATANQSTWNHRQSTGAGAGTDWAGSAGASTSNTDYDSATLGTMTYTANAVVGTEMTASLTASAVHDWFGAGNAHYGIRCSSAGVFCNVATSDDATTGYRPKLVVVYTLPSRTATSVMAALLQRASRTATLATATLLLKPVRTAQLVTAVLTEAGGGGLTRTATAVAAALSAQFRRTATSATAVLGTRIGRPYEDISTGNWTPKPLWEQVDEDSLAHYASILTGAYVQGDTYNPAWGQAPWDANTIAAFEGSAGKAMSIMHWGQAWYNSGSPQAFEPGVCDLARLHDSYSMINWNPWNGADPDADWQLADITAGTYDSYITTWAEDVRDWGHPLFVRMMDEMNGSWYPWCVYDSHNGNALADFVPAWQHIVDIFRAVGCTNARFVWTVNEVGATTASLTGPPSLYPGDNYVDWVAADIYRWPGETRDLETAFRATYLEVRNLAPSKPFMLGEWGADSNVVVPTKASFLSTALSHEIPFHFPRLQAVVYFNWNKVGEGDWPIENPAEAATAYAGALSHSRYTGHVNPD